MKNTRKYARRKVHTEILTVTPAMAEEMLATMPEGGNRSLRESHAQMLAGLIRGDRWHVTHSGIAFDQAGRLIDGQHRLRAIVIADMPVKIMVTLGLPVEAMEAVDRGSIRSIHDLLHLTHGVGGGATLTATCRVIQREFHGIPVSLTVADTIDLYRQYQPGFDWMLAALPARTAMNKAPYRAALVLGYMIHPGKGLVEGFLDDYRTGRHGSSREPAWRLREFTLKLGLTGDRIGDGELFAVACNALVAHFDGTLIQGVNKQPAGVALFRSLLGKGGAS